MVGFCAVVEVEACQFELWQFQFIIKFYRLITPPPKEEFIHSVSVCKKMKED